MTEGIEPPIPRARTEGLVIRELDGEVLVYDLERHKAHCLNQEAAFIWQRCDGETDVVTMTLLVAQTLSLPCDESIVRLALDQLSRAHLLSVRLPREVRRTRLSRRQVLRKIGTVAAVALPLVTSIVAPTAVEAATCLGTGAGCTSGAQCCSGTCFASFCL